MVAFHKGKCNTINIFFDLKSRGLINLFSIFFFSNHFIIFFLFTFNHSSRFHNIFNVSYLFTFLYLFNHIVHLG
jgi:hypothetical protein